MNVHFICGKIDLDKLNGIDLLVCPTDVRLSGAGGLDHAIREAAGPELTKALKGKTLKSGEVLVTEGFRLSVKGIVHAAIPGYAESLTNAGALRDCCRRILQELANPHKNEDCTTAAMTLPGVGACGWSFDESIADLWKMILEINRTHGSKYFGGGKLQDLFIYYPEKAIKSVLPYKGRASQAFFNAPDQWGMRGDPYLWYALMEHFDNPSFDKINLSDFVREIQRYFHQKSGTWLCGDTEVYVEEFAHGGMSSGWISPFMASIGIPLLCSNLLELDFPTGLQSSFIIPVELRSVHEKKYRLKLPYELLPFLERLRGKQSEVNTWLSGLVKE